MITLPRSQPDVFFAETLAGFADRLLSCGNKKASIDQDRYHVAQFVRFANRYPWECTRRDVDKFGAYLATEFKSSTVRGYQQSLRRYLDYCADPAYDWSARARMLFGEPFVQLCVPENTRKHTWIYDADPQRRPLVDEELRALFTSIEAQMLDAPRGGHKGALTAARDYAMIATALGFGLRAREVARLETFDLSSQVDRELKVAYGSYGVVTVRWGKAKRGGEPRRRPVLAVPLFEFAVETLRWYCERIRPRLSGAHPTALFVTERGTMMSESYASNRFGAWRARAKLDEHLCLHCLRHTYVSRMIEDGYPPEFVSDQVGHEDLDVIRLYLHLSDEYKRYTLRTAFETAG